ncbi:MAG TPA: hypothetical protein VMJ10_14130 [Kofleriaceae bacterium]|nr:hypothetical protein [Kofleriaceae bacterium]
MVSTRGNGAENADGRHREMPAVVVSPLLAPQVPQVLDQLVHMQRDHDRESLATNRFHKHNQLLHSASKSGKGFPRHGINAPQAGQPSNGLSAFAVIPGR